MVHRLSSQINQSSNTLFSFAGVSNPRQKQQQVGLRMDWGRNDMERTDLISRSEMTTLRDDYITQDTQTHWPTVRPGKDSARRGGAPRRGASVWRSRPPDTFRRIA